MLRRWNTKDAAAYAALFAEEGVVVGFDGTSIETPSSIRDHLESIFADHDPATYVAIVEDVRLLGAGVALLAGVGRNGPARREHDQVRGEHAADAGRDRSR